MALDRKHHLPLPQIGELAGAPIKPATVPSLVAAWRGPSAGGPTRLPLQLSPGVTLLSLCAPLALRGTLWPTLLLESTRRCGILSLIGGLRAALSLEAPERPWLRSNTCAGLSVLLWV